MSRSLVSLRALSAAAALTLGLAGAAQADYDYWYDDPDFGHVAGELTDGLLGGPVPAPAWACGRRFFSGVTLQWIGEFGQGVGPNNGGQQIGNAIVAHFGTAPGCKPRPRLENHPAGTLIAPPLGTHYVRIDPDAGSYWVDKNGSWPACNCVAPVGLKVLVADLRWKSLQGTLSLAAEAAEPTPALPPDKRWIDLQAWYTHAAALQRSASSVISNRRLTLLPTIETAVRQLEDLALASLAKAQRDAQACDSALRQDRRGDAHLACGAASRALSQAQRALATVVQEMH